MGLICKVFGHKWFSYKCRRCGAIKDEPHKKKGAEQLKEDMINKPEILKAVNDAANGGFSKERLVMLVNQLGYDVTYTELVHAQQAVAFRGFSKKSTPDAIENYAQEAVDIFVKRNGATAENDDFDAILAEIRVIGEKINNFDVMVKVAHRAKVISDQCNAKMEIRDFEYAWDGIAGWHS